MWIFTIQAISPPTSLGRKRRVRQFFALTRARVQRISVTYLASGIVAIASNRGSRRLRIGKAFYCNCLPKSVLALHLRQQTVCVQLNPAKNTLIKLFSRNELKGILSLSG
jgi:hypothetical protein